ncbi:MAG: LacI family DNA-binding transcriptional regulator [Maritimibacter sp.]|nr:LacI family DNA-binding transcriptional regulator [Maritimibacter sp.]
MTRSKPAAKPPARPRPGNLTRKPTLKTIAEMSGLAVATVSRALNDAPDIGADTKKLVRRIASDIGYVPNRAGVRLRTGRTNVITLVLTTEPDVMDHTARLIASIAEALRHTSFHLTITPYFPDQDPLDPVRYIVETGSADAVILNQTQPDDPRVRYLVEKGFPFATHGRTDMPVAHPWFDFDNSAFGRLAVDGLAGRGARSIVMIAPPREQSYSQHMIAAAAAECAARGIAFLVEDKTTADSPNEHVCAGVKARLAETPEVDAYITGSAKAAMATTAAIESTGRRLGRDINIFTKEAVSLLNLFRPEIMTVHEDVTRAGRFLARAAMQAIREPEAAPMQELEVPGAAAPSADKD